MKFLVMGVVGFIGLYVSKCLLDVGYQVVGIDNLNDYYDVNFKLVCLDLLKFGNFIFYKMELVDCEVMVVLFVFEKFDCVIYLVV